MVYIPFHWPMFKILIQICSIFLLIDNRQKDSLDIARSTAYGFNISNADTTTYGANRFVLDIRLKPLPLYKLLSFLGQKVTHGVQLNWQRS